MPIDESEKQNQKDKTMTFDYLAFKRIADEDVPDLEYAPVTHRFVRPDEYVEIKDAASHGYIAFYDRPDAEAEYYKLTEDPIQKEGVTAQFAKGGWSVKTDNSDTHTKEESLGKYDPDEYVVNVTEHGREGVTMIDRSTQFGNPFRLEKDGGEFTRGESIDWYRRWFMQKTGDREFRQAVEALRGETLGCYCKPDACHGDVIIEYLNEEWVDAPADAPNVICFNCKSGDVECVEIVGEAPNPAGSEYKCNDCESRFEIVDDRAPRE